MPKIAAFQGVRYAEAAGETGALVAPPYDVLDDAGRAEYAGRSPHNVVHLTLPEGVGESQYAKAAELWRRWQEDGVMKTDETPAVYVLTQAFRLPDGRDVVRTGLMTRMRLHDFEDGVVLPHERTLSAPVEDRIKLTRAVAANLEPIFLVFSDDDARARSALAAATTGPVLAECTTDDGVVQRLYALTDPDGLKALGAAVGPQPAVIADGHHRYQTALAYRDVLGKETEGAHQYLLAFLCPLEDQGLVILPTHRIVHSLPEFDVGDFLSRAGQWFDVSVIEADPGSPEGRQAVTAALEAAGAQTNALALVLPDGKAHLLALRPGASPPGLPAEPDLRALDVSVLHGVLLQEILGLTPESQARQENLGYVKSTAGAFDRILAAGSAREGQALFLMNATPMAQVKSVAQAGHRMPQKSTYFFPKLPSGLLFNPVSADEAVDAL
jgi:uncharacterized protein (DUF1015 family)